MTREEVLKTRETILRQLDKYLRAMCDDREISNEWSMIMIYDFFDVIKDERLFLNCISIFETTLTNLIAKYGTAEEVD